MSDLFSYTSEDCSIVYKRMRDEAETNRLAKKGRDHCDELWKVYEPFADTHFKSEFSDPNLEKLHARWFEMYLAVALIEKGLKVCRKPNDIGPDILLEMEDRRIWIETTCATRGDPQSPDYVPKQQLGGLKEEELDRYLLRITNTLREKEKKFKEYYNKGIVKYNDTLAIAININLTDAAYIYDIFGRALYGEGDPDIELNKYTRKINGVSHKTLKKIPKCSPEGIDLGYFIKGTMPCISCALAFSGNLLMYGSKLGDDCVTYPNLTSDNKWIQGSVTMGIEWSPEENENDWSLIKIKY